MKQEIITKIETTYTPDGSGGYTEETREIGSYDVKLGVSKDVKKATAYGVQCEQMLEVVADEPMACSEGSYWIIIGPQGPVGPVGPKGADGTMTFEDLTEEQKESLRGPQGIPGPEGPASTVPGPAGTDGFSPIVSTLEVAEGTVVSIQDKDGVKSFTVKNGAQGEQGPAGADGTNYTITNADYDAIANVVFSKMTNAEQVRY